MWAKKCTVNRITFLLLLGTIISSCENKTLVQLPEGKQVEKGRASFEIKRLSDPLTGEIPRGIRSKELKFVSSIPILSQTSQRTSSIQPLGPYNVGGRTRAIQIDRSDSSVILATAATGGIYRSEQLGEPGSWRKVSGPDQVLSMSCLVQDPRVGKENIWYAGSGEALGPSGTLGPALYLGNGLMKSTDGGRTWVSLASTQTSSLNFSNSWQAVYNLAVHPTDTADIIYAATVGGIFISEDGGDTWNWSLKGWGTSSIVYYSDVAVSPSGVTYATLGYGHSNSGIWRKEEGGSWQNILPPGFPGDYGRFVIEVDPHNENRVYFLGSTPNSGLMTEVYFGEQEWNSLYKYEYDTSGGVWTDLSANLPNTGSDFDRFNSQGGYDLTLSVHPFDSNYLFIGGTNLYRSSDGFTSDSNWIQIGGYNPGTTWPDFKIYNTQHPDQHDMEFTPSGQLISATDGGIFKWQDPLADSVKWQSLNKGYQTSQLYTIAVRNTPGTTDIAGGFQDNGTFYTNSLSPSQEWTFPSTGDGSYCALTANGNYFSRQNGDVVKVELNSSGLPVAYQRLDPIQANDNMFIHPFLVDPDNEDVMFFPSGNKLWRNDSLSFISLNNEYDSISFGWSRFNDTLLANQDITALAKSSSSSRLYIGSSIGRIYRIDSAYHSESSFQDITGSWTGGYTSCIAVDPNNADRVMICFANYHIYSLYFSEDGGDNWIKVAGNLEEYDFGGGNGPSFRWASFLPFSDGTEAFLVGTSTGLYAAFDLVADSTEWFHVAPETLGNAIVNMFSFRESDGLLAVATHGYGVWSGTIDHSWLLTGLQDEVKSAVTFKCYPNPASEELRMHLSTPGEVQMFNSEGKLCWKSLVKQRHSLQLNRFTKGLYFIKLKGEDEVQKIIVQ